MNVNKDTNGNYHEKNWLWEVDFHVEGGFNSVLGVTVYKLYMRKRLDYGLYYDSVFKRQDCKSMSWVLIVSALNLF
jgi:hypothetical protein